MVKKIGLLEQQVIDNTADIARLKRLLKRLYEIALPALEQRTRSDSAVIAAGTRALINEVDDALEGGGADGA